MGREALLASPLLNSSHPMRLVDPGTPLDFGVGEKEGSEGEEREAGEEMNNGEREMEKKGEVKQQQYNSPPPSINAASLAKTPQKVQQEQEAAVARTGGTLRSPVMMTPEPKPPQPREQGQEQETMTVTVTQLVASPVTQAGEQQQQQHQDSPGQEGSEQMHAPSTGIAASPLAEADGETTTQPSPGQEERGLHYVLNASAPLVTPAAESATVREQAPRHQEPHGEDQVEERGHEKEQEQEREAKLSLQQEEEQQQKDEEEQYQQVKQQWLREQEEQREEEDYQLQKAAFMQLQEQQETPVLAQQQRQEEEGEGAVAEALQQHEQGKPSPSLSAEEQQHHKELQVCCYAISSLSLPSSSSSPSLLKLSSLSGSTADPSRLRCFQR
jgi:hypothetical protein